MNTDREKMLVEAICNGTVLDHIPSDKLFKIVTMLGLDALDNPVTIGQNLDSKRCGKKGVIKITDRFFSPEEISRIAILAPHVQVNVIRDYEVVEKRQVLLPDAAVGLVRCPNSKCITNWEPMSTRFAVTLQEGSSSVALECQYCGRKMTGDAAELL